MTRIALVTECMHGNTSISNEFTSDRDSNEEGEETEDEKKDRRIARQRGLTSN